MYKSSRVSYRKRPRRPQQLPVSAPPRGRASSIPSKVSVAVPASAPATTPVPKKEMEVEVPSFEEFLVDAPTLEEDVEELCPDVVLYFHPRAASHPPMPSPNQAGGQPGDAAGRPISSKPNETPLYSNLPTISLKTNPAPTNILSDFGKTIGKGVQKATQQAKIPLNSLGGQIKEVANQVATNLPVPPPPPPKKSQLEKLLEASKPKRLYQDLTIDGEPRVLVMYPEAIIVGKDVTVSGEQKMAVEVEWAVLVGMPIESQSENSQKKLQKLFGSFGSDGQRDFDFSALPRFLRDVPHTQAIKLSEVAPPVMFPTMDNKLSFLDTYSGMCLRSVKKSRHEVVQGTIWSAVVVEDMEALSHFSPDQVNETDHLGRTALHYAAALLDGGQSVSILLGMGADSSILDDELSTPLHLAAKAGNVLAVHSLLRAGADPNARDLTERTAFFWAAAKSIESADLSSADPYIQVMEALVDVGRCDVETRDTEDRTAIHLCIDETGGARVETLGALLRAPLNLDPSSVRGDLARTPLHMLCVEHVEDPDTLRIAATLLDSGARVNSCDKRGDTPLHLLLRGDVGQPYPIMVDERVHLALLLVRYGARLDVANAANHTPAEAAKMQRMSFEDAIAKWAAKKEPAEVGQMAADPKMLWNLPRAADKAVANSVSPEAAQGLRSVTARLNRAINDNLSMPWQAESDVSQCYTCRKAFSLMQRKYHCRHCGLVHCVQCTTKTFTMCPPASQQPSSGPVKDRVCDSCFNGMCSTVERTSMALRRMSQDREAAKRRQEAESRSALGLDAEGGANKGQESAQDSAMNATSRARDALGERGDRIKSIQEKTAKMRDDAANFAQLADKLKQQQEKSLWPF